MGSAACIVASWQVPSARLRQEDILQQQVDPELLRQVTSFSYQLGHVIDDAPPAQVTSPGTPAPPSDGALVPAPGTPQAATSEDFTVV
eukprot:9749624-Alexandrium_andersonii.AAC.1